LAVGVSLYKENVGYPMKIVNQTKKSYYLLFEKLFEFRRFRGISDKKSEIAKMVSEYKKNFSEAKFIVIEMPSKKEIHI